MSFCSPTNGSGRPNAFGSNSAACSNFPDMLHVTEQIPKTQQLVIVMLLRSHQDYILALCCARITTTLARPEVDPDSNAAVATRASEEVGVARVARDADGMEGGDGAEHQRALRSRHAMCARDVLDVAHRAASADREIEQRRPNSASEDASLEGASAMMRNVEDRLVE